MSNSIQQWSGKNIKSEKEEAQETLEILFEMQTIMNCGLDRQQLQICVALIENGVNPEALAHVMNEMKTEASTYQKISNK